MSSFDKNYNLATFELCQHVTIILQLLLRGFDPDIQQWLVIMIVEPINFM